MNRDRLQHLKTILSNIDPNFRFDMSIFIHDSPCGTAGCALGYAGLDQTFQHDGLIVDLKRSHVTFMHYFGLAAGQKFFELTRDQTDYLFNPDYYEWEDRVDVDEITPQHVIEHINVLLQR